MRAFEDVKSKVLSKVAGWKMRSLSQAGRIVLIKVVATALPVYCMSTFLLPRGWCEDIDRILKHIWWGFPSQKTKNFTPQSLGRDLSTKEIGGLGLRKLHEINKALVAKLAWKFFSSPDSLGLRKLSLLSLRAFVFGRGMVVP